MFCIINRKENTVSDNKRLYVYKDGAFFNRKGKEIIKEDSNGYLRIELGDTRIYQHRLVCAIEYTYLDIDKYDIHHISGVKWDNHPNNLLVCDKSVHSRLHGFINKLNELGKSQLNSRLYKFSVNRKVLTEEEYNSIVREVLA